MHHDYHRTADGCRPSMSGDGERLDDGECDASAQTFGKRSSAPAPTASKTSAGAVAAVAHSSDVLVAALAPSSSSTGLLPASALGGGCPWPPAVRPHAAAASSSPPPSPPAAVFAAGCASEQCAPAAQASGSPPCLSAALDGLRGWPMAPSHDLAAPQISPLKLLASRQTLSAYPALRPPHPLLFSFALAWEKFAPALPR